MKVGVQPGAIILCGGNSSRMGRDKATLPFGPESMLQRVCRLISTVIDVGNIVVVAAPQQVLPELPGGVLISHDERQGRGPLEGLAAGMRSLLGRADVAYVTSCDVPLLVPQFVQHVIDQLGDHDIAVPKDRERFHPLSAVYRLTLLPRVQQLLDEDRLRVRLLFEFVKTREIAVEEFRCVDPQLASLENLNNEEDYRRALRRAGFNRIEN